MLTNIICLCAKFTLSRRWCSDATVDEEVLEGSKFRCVSDIFQARSLRLQASLNSVKLLVGFLDYQRRRIAKLAHVLKSLEYVLLSFLITTASLLLKGLAFLLIEIVEEFLL